MNIVLISGNLTRNAESKYTASGKQIVKFSVAINESWKGADGEWQKKTHFIDCDYWTEKDVAGRLAKGVGVIVEGSLKQDRWESEGGTRSKVCVNIKSISFVARAPAENGGQERQSAGDGGRQPGEDGEKEPPKEEPKGGEAKKVSDFPEDIPF
jgi:single-strand DNA-binding protein